MTPHPPCPQPQDQPVLQSPPIRTALISTKRLAIVCPTPTHNLDGPSHPSWSDRHASRLRFRVRLWTARLAFRYPSLAQFVPRVRHLRMLLRLALLKYKVKRRRL